MTRIDEAKAETLAQGEPPAAAAPKRRAFRRWALMLSVPLLLLVVGLYFWLTSGKTVTTDNAYVGAHVVSVAPEITGLITDVSVRENQEVRKGDLLFRIDPTPYRIALMEADAAVGNARLQVAQMSSDYGSKVADIGAMTSDVSLARENFRRQKELLARGFTTRANFDAANASLASAIAKQKVAAADAQSAKAMIGTTPGLGHPQIAAAIATREKAALNLARTEIRAPIDGRIAQTDRLEPGATAMQALPMVSVVDSRDTWIEANFKETQLDKVRAGQIAEIDIDAIPGHSYKAVVTGIGSGTGSQFSVLPAQNATGNWVKVTQRVPVRLRLTEQPDRPLVAGWSAHVTIHVAD